MHTQQTISMKLLPEPRKLLAARTICINLYPSQFSWDLLEFFGKKTASFISGQWRCWESEAGDLGCFSLSGEKSWCNCWCQAIRWKTRRVSTWAFKINLFLKCVLPSWMLESPWICANCQRNMPFHRSPIFWYRGSWQRGQIGSARNLSDIAEIIYFRCDWRIPLPPA